MISTQVLAPEPAAPEVTKSQLDALTALRGKELLSQALWALRASPIRRAPRERPVDSEDESDDDSVEESDRLRVACNVLGVDDVADRRRLARRNDETVVCFGVS